MWGAGRPAWIDRLLRRASLVRWRRVADAARTADPARLRRDVEAARALRRQLDRVIHVAEARLAHPLPGNPAVDRPADADWTWRPEVWCGPLAVPGLAAMQSQTRLGTELALFHDCRTSEITLRQIRNRRSSDVAAYGLRLDVFRFDGSYLSLALDLPQAACDGLGPDHLMRLGLRVEMEQPVGLYARLNLRLGPNTEQIVREVPAPQADGEGRMLEFDLAYGRLAGRRVDGLWLDLILDGAQMTQVTLRDLTLIRRRRAAL